MTPGEASTSTRAHAERQVMITPSAPSVPMVLLGVMMIIQTWKNFKTIVLLFSGRLPVQSSRQGFTLLELLLAIGLMGLMLGLSLPRIGAVKSAYFATEEAKEVANTIRAARVDAITNRTTVCLMTTSEHQNILEGRRLTIQSWYAGDSAGLAVENRGWRDIWEAPLVCRSEVSGHLELESPEIGILFFANGTSTGGEIMIHDDDGHLQHHFHVLPATGDLFIQQ